MNKRVLFLVAVLSLSLLAGSFAAPGSTSDAADVNIDINEYVSISPLGDSKINFLIENPKATDETDFKTEMYKVECNRQVDVSLSPYGRIYIGPAMFGLEFKIYHGGEYIAQGDSPITLDPGEHDNVGIAARVTPAPNFPDQTQIDLNDQPGTYLINNAVTITVS